MNAVLSENLCWLQSVHSQLYEILNEAHSEYIYSTESDCLYKNDEVVSTGLSVQSIQQFEAEIANPSRLRIAREDLSGSQPLVETDLVEALVDSLGHKILPNIIPNVFSGYNEPNSSQFGNNYLLLGISTLPAFFESVKSGRLDSPGTLTIAESSLPNILIALSHISFQELVSYCKEHKIAFHLIFEKEFIPLREQLYEYLRVNLILSYYGTHVISAPTLHPSLTLLRSYIFAKSGLTPRLLSNLGTSSDEYNQVLEYLGNLCLNPKSSNVIACLPKLNPSDTALIAASGPSIDSELSTIKELQAKVVVFASGSSLGTLLKNGIRVDFFVHLERGSGAYYDLLQLIYSGFNLQGITLVASSATDPRISQLFFQTYYFNRPKATFNVLAKSSQSSTLPYAGPECANSSLELCMYLSAQNILLFGCDFSAAAKVKHRSANAIGISPRILDIPVKGSQGKTVFTDGQLSLVSEVFEYVCLCNPNVSISRVGEGIALKGCRTTDGQSLINETSSLSADYLARLVIHNNNYQSPERLPDLLLLKEVIKSLPSVVSDIRGEIMQRFSSSKCLDAPLHRYLSGLLDYGDPTDTATAPARYLMLRMFRQVFFSIAQVLNDSNSQSWPDACERFLRAYDICADLLIRTMNTFDDLASNAILNSGNDSSTLIPSVWSPDAISMKIQRSEHYYA